MKNNSFTNIPQNAMNVQSQNRIENRVTMSVFDSGKITFTTFAIFQFMLGIQFLHEFSDDFDGKSISAKMFKLYVKLQSVMNEMIMKNQQSVEIDINRSELILMKYWLELRMQHCELERDNRSEKFNPDTYIGQKLLLIDIRELLIGEVID